MILFIGQVGTEAPSIARHFQEVEYRLMFATALPSGWRRYRVGGAYPRVPVARVPRRSSGRPGPVVLALPEDVLSEVVAGSDPAYQVIQPQAAPGEVARAMERLQTAERPLLIVGGGGWTAQASLDLAAFAEAHALPTVASFRCQDYLDNEHPRYVGDLGLGPNPKLAERVRAADLLLVVGARMGEASSRGYTLIDIPSPRQTLIHVHADASELGRVYRPHLALNASAPSFFAAARGLARRRRRIVMGRLGRGGARRVPGLEPPITSPGPVQLSEIVAWLGSPLPPDAIITNGAGNYTVWLHRFFRYRQYRTQLGPTSGSMGYGLPAAVAASLGHPDRPGDLLRRGWLLPHARPGAGHGGPARRAAITLVINNESLGTIRAHQERRYPGRPSGTTLRNPDFAALARAYGAHGETVTRTEDFAAGLRPRAGLGPAGRHRDQARRRGAHAVGDAQPDPDRSAGPALTGTLPGTFGRGGRLEPLCCDQVARRPRCGFQTERLSRCAASSISPPNQKKGSRRSAPPPMGFAGGSSA